MSSLSSRSYYEASTTTDILEGFANSIAELPQDQREGGLLWIRDTRSPAGRYVITENGMHRRIDRNWVTGRGCKIHHPQGSARIWGIPYSQFKGAIWVSQDSSVLVALRQGPGLCTLCCYPWATRAVLKLIPKEQWEERMLPSGFITYFQKTGVSWSRNPTAPSWAEPAWFDIESLRNNRNAVKVAAGIVGSAPGEEKGHVDDSLYQSVYGTPHWSNPRS